MLTVLEYDEMIQTLFSRLPSKAYDLQNIKTLLAFFQNPQESLQCVHIAGTNGKGSVSAKIAYALQHAGYKVGLYISPHLLDYRERITINGIPIPQDRLLFYHKELEQFAKDHDIIPHFFESTTAYAFRYFAEENVDIAVIETGLGGRLDATNVIHSMLSIITSVSEDHLKQLGGTIDAIAEQKAGIIKPKVPVIIGPYAKHNKIFQKAHELDAPIHIVEKQSCFYDTENQLIAKEALHILSASFPMSVEDIKAGLSTSLPCRFEKKGNMIFDVAHNPDGFKRLSDALSHLYPYRTFRFLIGMTLGKDPEKCLQVIEKKAHFVHFVKADVDKAVSPEELGKIFATISTCPYCIEPSISEGFAHAKSQLDKKEILVVCGSFYIMANTRGTLS